MTETAVFGGGCFWCTEAVFSGLRGVLHVTPGYAGGNATNPSYNDVCGGKTGHAEGVRIEYDPGSISYNQLLEVFFNTHDPTSLNFQGVDVGEQYRSIILYLTETQRELAEHYIKKLIADKVYKDPIVTQIKPLTHFYEAEEYHKGYYYDNLNQPYCQAIIAPKLAKLKTTYKSLIKSQ